MSESEQERASRYLRTLVSYAKRMAVYSLGVDINGEHADIVCILTDDVPGGALIPIARLLNKAEVAALTELGAALESVESDCAGRC